jgi:hypothetical protein
MNGSSSFLLAAAMLVGCGDNGPGSGSDSGAARDSTASTERTRAVDDRSDVPAWYVASTSRVDPAERDAYVAHLEEIGMPVWRSLQQDGLLADRLVLEQKSVASRLEGVPPWNFLQMTRLADGIDPERYLEAARQRLVAAGFSPPGKLLRVEILESTPRSFYPMPREEDPAVEMEYFIEYINVFDGFLGEYRESMVVNSGPAVGRLVDDGLVRMFIALETRSVEYADDGMPSWNQIHVLATPADTEFPAEAFDRALREVNPAGGGFADVFGRLDDIRTKPRESVSREVTSLRIAGAARGPSATAP